MNVSVHSAEVLTWDACVKEVTTNNLDLKAARENVNVFKYKKRALWSEYLPAVNAGLNTSYGDSALSSNTNDILYSASLSVTQNIFSGFQSTGKFKEAEANFESQEAGYRSVIARVSYDLKYAYALVLYAKDYIKLSEDIIKRRQDNLNLVQLRFESGTENKGSLLLAKASLEEAKYDNNLATRLLETSRQQLAAVLGRKELSADVDIDSNIPMSDPEAKIDLEKVALETPEHQVAVSQTKSNKAKLTVARSAFYPSLDFTGQATQQGTRWPFPNSSWSMMLGLSFPLFNGGRDLYTTYSASSLFSASMFSQDQTDLQLYYKLQQSYNNFLDSSQRVGVYKLYVQAAMVRAEIARNKYNNGLLSFENWDIIENDLISKEKTSVQTVRDRHIAEANWLMTQGKGVIQ